MQAVLLKLLSWLAQKLAAAALIAGLALAAYGIWLFLQEEGVLERNRVARLHDALHRREQLTAAQQALEARIAALRAEIETQRQHVKQAEKVMAALREMDSWWEWLFGDRRQQAANRERLQQLEEKKKDFTGRWTEALQAVEQAEWQREGLGQALERTAEEIGQFEAGRSRVRQYLMLAWDKTKWWVIGALAGYFGGPTLWALALYYGVAGFLAGGRPIRLGAETPELPEVGGSHVSIEARLRPGETLRVKEKFLQSSDEGLVKRTRFVLDWRIPFTSLACGLIELVEMRHAGREGELRVTLSNGDDPHLELAPVTVPAGGSLVLRPSFLAGVVQAEGEPLKIRRHWRIFRWQAWISGQFRFFEFQGPCRLLVSGSRGVRAERLEAPAGGRAPARRTNQDATIGFTPGLDYRPVRAETFWSYYRGMNPLFDDLFAGRGLFLLQETATAGAAARAGRFWAGVWNGVLRVFGW
jgi:hypothetical protein